MSEDHSSEISNILVFCRFRPPNEYEESHHKNISLEIYEDNTTLKILPKEELSHPQEFSFDWIFPIKSSQDIVYKKSSKPIIKAVLEGFNGTVLAYGQTASGKTFTMTGLDLESKEQHGIIPRMVKTVFKHIQKAEENIEFILKISYCEIYMEKIRDLLNPGKNNLKIRENKTQGIFIEDMIEVSVASEEEIFDIMKLGGKNREVSATNMNAGSSRSHAIFILSVMQTNSIDLSTKIGKLYLVDLAGSEKVGKTNVTGKHLEEAKKINTSLTMLGLVINALTDGKSTHIPYRDSKLTRVLQDSLGGNAKTSLIITCSPSLYNESETLSTLRFGFRAKSIKNKPKINHEYSVAELKNLLAKVQEELSQKDYVILTQKEALAAYGYESGCSLDTSYRLDEISFEDLKKSEMYDEVLNELHDIQVKYDVQSKHFRRASCELESAIIENEEQKKTGQFIYSQIQELQQKINSLEKSIKKKDEMIENLSITIDSMQKELTAENTKNVDLQKNLITVETTLQGKKSYENASLLSEISLLVQQLDHEKSRNFLITQEMQNTKIDMQKCMEIEITEHEKLDILDKSYKQDKAHWEELEKKYKENLEKVVEIHNKTLENLRIQQEQYKRLRSFLNDNELNTLCKLENVERSLERLNIIYHQIVLQNSTLNVSKQVLEKKISRIGKKNMELLDENKNLKEKLKLTQKLTYAFATGKKDTQENMQDFQIFQKSKVKRVLKGGIGFYQRTSERSSTLLPPLNSDDSPTIIVEIL